MDFLAAAVQHESEKNTVFSKFSHCPCRFAGERESLLRGDIHNSMRYTVNESLKGLP
jgi:hypothetical protein